MDKQLGLEKRDVYALNFGYLNVIFCLLIHNATSFGHQIDYEFIGYPHDLIVGDFLALNVSNGPVRKMKQSLCLCVAQPL